VTNFLKTQYSNEQSAAVKENPHLRLTFDLSSVLRALAKDMGSGAATYGHCEGDKFAAFAEHVLTKAMFLKITRIDLGERQDIETESAFVAYWNRPYLVQFLKSAYYSSPNLLRDHRFIEMTALQIVAALRCRAAWHDKFTLPMRFSARRTRSTIMRSRWRR
jgi:hypothetical protein